MIKRVEKGQIPECAGVIRDSFLTVAAEFGFTRENAPRFTAFAVTDESLTEQFQDENRHMFAHFSENGQIAGFYSLRIQENRACELNNLCVRENSRHKGVGEALLRHAFAQAKALGCEKMHIGIVEENARLKRWYASFGFQHTGTKKFDFFPFTCGYMEKDLLTEQKSIPCQEGRNVKGRCL